MSWMLLSLVSAALLGVYDIAKKLSTRHNAVPVVLLLSTLTGAAIWTPLLVWQSLDDDFPIGWLSVAPLSWADHGYLAAKSLLVGTSWTLAFFAIKHLPLSIAAPIRSSSPLWTIGLAICFLGERPAALQWLGIAVTLVSFWALSLVGRREGIHFSRNRWVALMMGSTLLGAFSSVYDRVLLSQMGFNAATVQAWFTIYLVPVMIPLVIRWAWRRGRAKRSSEVIESAFEFRWVIFAISPLLLVADLVYFTALTDPDALVSVVSTLRRCSVVVTMAVGARGLGESQLRRKSYCVAGLLTGVVLVVWAERS